MNPEKFHNRKSKAILKAIAGAILLWYFGMGLNQIVISYYEGIRGSQAVPKAMAAMEREFVEVELPLEVDKEVEYWMNHFSTLNREEFLEQLSRAGLYREMIRTKLIEQGMPKELLYLAQIESGYVANARSGSSAYGVWQFMGPTARQYGLRMDFYVDERRDAVQATDAALSYLKELHERYGSWYLAAAAYNAGPTRVSQLLRKYTDGRMGDENLYWEIIDHLPKETAQYVPKLLAVTYLAEYGQVFDVSGMKPYVYDVVWVPGGTSLPALTERLGMHESELKGLNPHLIRGMTPLGEIYPLRVPVGSSTTFASEVGLSNRRARLADD